MSEATTNPSDAIADMVGEVGDHLSNIYLGKDNPRRDEFVGRLEEMVRAQLQKEQFAMVHGVPVESVVSASEALAASPGSDEPMSPMRTRDNVHHGHFRDSKAMTQKSDVLLNVDLESGDQPDQISVTPVKVEVSEEEDEELAVYYMSKPAAKSELTCLGDDGPSIVASDPSLWTRSYNDLQRKISDWGLATFGETTLDHKFVRMTEEMDEILDQPNDVAEWADLLMLVMHGAETQGISVDEILNAGYSKLAVLNRRQYHYNPETERWNYSPLPGYSDDDIQFSSLKE